MSCFQLLSYRPTLGKILLITSVIALLCGESALMAQCPRLGWVVSVMPGCGATIKEASSGQLIRVVGGDAEALPGGKTIHFGTGPGTAGPGCPIDGIPTFTLTCWNDSILPEAHFTYSVNTDNPLQYTFQAQGFDPATQTCQWSFNGGATSGGPSGSMVQYTFPQAGLYNVCLLVTDNAGLTSQACQEVLVSSQPADPCGYHTYVTAVGTELYAKLLPQGSAAGPLQHVRWTNGQNGPLLGELPILSVQLPAYGNYLICAEYSVKDTMTGAVCTNVACTPLSLIEPGCANPQLMTTVQTCPSEQVPVCGCDGITYSNECEALAAGATTWWAGECSAMYGSCVADLDIQMLSGNPDVGYTVLFKNLSGGNSSLSHLDFGDGTPIWEATQWDTVTHTYAHGDVYRIDLSVWKPNDCASTVTKLFITDAFNLTAGNLPEKPDYVLPGDANHDLQPNVYDLLDIGVGYLTSGAPRSSASSEYVPQFAANWPDTLQGNLNFKHFDCDGDGMVLDLDADLIEPHYSPIDSTMVPHVPGAPEVWVEFPQDVITIDPNNPQALEITANVMVGSEAAPALDLHGLAFALMYPEYVEHDPVVDYKNEFFGISNHILWLPKDNYARRQLDLGFTKKYSSSSGFGQIATVTFRSDFIIIIDVIDREIGDTKAFSIPVRGLKAIDAEGHELNFGTSIIQDTLWIQLLETSGTHEKALDQQVTVYPNPAADEVRVITGNLEVETVQAVNPLGQVIYSAQGTSGLAQRLQVGDWPAGLYTLRLQTPQGLVEKKLLVQ